MKFINTKCCYCGGVRQIVDGVELKNLRLNHKMSFRQLGKEVQLSASYLYDIEKNRRLCPQRLVDYWRKKIEEER